MSKGSMNFHLFTPCLLQAIWFASHFTVLSFSFFICKLKSLTKWTHTFFSPWLYYPLTLDSFKAPMTCHCYSCSHPVIIQQIWLNTYYVQGVLGYRKCLWKKNTCFLPIKVIFLFHNFPCEYHKEIYRII